MGFPAAHYPFFPIARRGAHASSCTSARVLGARTSSIGAAREHRIDVRRQAYGAILEAFEVADRDGHVANVVLSLPAIDAWEADPVYLGAVIGRFAGRIDAAVTYLLGDEDSLTVDLEVTTDRATPVNRTHHAYFNLAGAGAGDVLDHRLTLDADAALRTDYDPIPTGERLAVAGTPFDFRNGPSIGERVSLCTERNGFDNTFVLRTGRGSCPRAARLVHPESGRTLEIFTTQPAILRPGETYRHRTVFRFGIEP